ncbi:aldo-keto reductase family 1 member A1-like [Glandiceps talaboti]
MATYAKLYTGAKMPMVGLGTWQSSPGDVGKAVVAALEYGYRNIDCALVYENEAEVGEALKTQFEKNLERNDVFICSKLWHTMHAAEDVKPACQQTLKDLGLDYVDLYLMHCPYGFKKTKTGELYPKNADGSMMYSDVPLIETWRAMEELVDEGLCKHIGLSNANSKQVTEVCENGRIKPAVLQVGCNPYFNQSKLINLCKEKGIVVTAYTPLGFSNLIDEVLLENPLLKSIGDKYKKSPAQVTLRFNVQRGVVVIPKSVTPSRIAENKEIFDFELTEDDMKSIEGLHRDGMGHIMFPWACNEE